MVKSSFLLIIILFLSSQLYSREKDVNDEPGVSIFYEMGGKFFSLADGGNW
jgi:hypothetical protein